MLYDEKKAGTWLCLKANQDQEGICFAKKGVFQTGIFLDQK